MSFGLRYEQLKPVAGNVRAGIVSYDGSNPEHRAALREALPRFLGSLGAVHGETFPDKNIEAVMAIADAGDMKVDFLLVALETCGPVMIAGLATGAPTFSAAWDEHNKLMLFPVEHGEDMCVDKETAALFREHTRDSQNPNGIGAGTWFMREQIRRSLGNPDWVPAGRDNEHSPNNPPIIGVINKFGAVRSTVEDSAVLQLNEPIAVNMGRRWGVDVKTEALPVDRLGLRLSDNSFLTRWSGEDGAQQIAVIFTKMASTFDGHPVVWTKIKSNGILPDGEMLKEVLASLLSDGCKEISARQWGVPRNTSYGLSGVFGGPVPVMHLHACKEPKIIEALLQMEASHRTFGHETMVSGVMDLRNVSDPEAILGRPLPAATQISGIDPDRDAHKPYFDIAPDMGVGRYLSPRRPAATGTPDNDSVATLAA